MSQVNEYLNLPPVSQALDSSLLNWIRAVNQRLELWMGLRPNQSQLAEVATVAQLTTGAIGTSQLAANTATMPVSATSTSAALSAGTTTVQTISISTEGSLVFLQASFGCSYSSASNVAGTVLLKRDGTTIASMAFEIPSVVTNASGGVSLPMSISATDTPALGNHTYTLAITSSATGTCVLPTLFALELRR